MAEAHPDTDTDTDANPIGCAAWGAALALIGVPFRLHGRDARRGLDCVGLVAAAYAAAGVRDAAVPDRYRLRGQDVGAVQDWLMAAGLQMVGDDARTGDVALCSLGFGQLHLLLTGPDGAVHAHAGLGKVVLSPGPLPGALIGRWRWVAVDERRGAP